MKIKISFFLILFLCVGCLGNDKKNACKNYYRQGYLFLTKNKKYLQRHALQLTGYGVNTSGKKNYPSNCGIHQFEIMFHCPKALDIDKSRLEFISVVEDFLNEVNTSEVLKGCLYDPPFTSKNLNFSVFFYEDNNNKAKDKYVTSCMLFDNTILYTVEFSDGSVSLFYKELYEVAKKIVENNIPTGIKIKKSDTRQPGIPNYGKDDEEEKRNLEKLHKELEKYN